MECCSKFAFINRKVKLDQDLESGDDEVDTNVFSVKFSSLKAGENNLFMGDPFFCGECKSVISNISKVYGHDEYAAISNQPVNPQEEEKDDGKKIQPIIFKEHFIPVSDMKPGERVWICEFCGKHNKISLDNEEIPKDSDVYFLLQSSDQLKSKMKTAPTASNDETVIFCIDNSGSMCVTSEVKDKNLNLNYGISEEEKQMLRQFIEFGADQYLPNQSKGSTWVSRKQCVAAAIENQLTEMAGTHPNRKTGLVVFSDDVIIIGDGLAEPVTVAGDKLYKQEVCLEEGNSNYEKLLSAPVSKSAEKILTKLQKLEEKGTTALGPALLSSIGLASHGKAGSMVIVCTDGLANIGLGRMDTPDQEEASDKFYESLGKIAKEKGILVSVITIKGEGCKVDKLAKIADMTGGSVTRVNPDKIHEDFANILKEELVARDVDVKIRLHRCIAFRNEEPAFLADENSLYQKHIGNITAHTELTFEYSMKSDEDLNKLGVQLDQLTEVPFQAQIVYTAINGNKISRVITLRLKTTDQIENAGKDVNLKMLAARAQQVTSLRAEEGNLIKAKKTNKKWDKFLNQAKEVNRDNADI
jgi:hypothetical protein